jgi:Exopolyphosphatase-related proteins
VSTTAVPGAGAVPPPLERENLPEAVAALQAASDIVLACHVNPDGDTLGCMLSLGLALEGMGKRVTLLSADGVPEIYTFMPGVERIERGTERRDFDLAVVVDAGDLNRIGAANRATVEAAPVLMDIDHHVTGGEFGHVRLLDATAAATAEIVYDLLLALGVRITPPLAENLLCALLTDTGSFRFMNVTPRTFALAGGLMQMGASPAPIAERVFDNRSFAAQKLLGRALESLRRNADGSVAWAHVTQADFREFGGTDEDTEGIVNAVRAVRGTRAALFLREMPNGKLRVSLRAQDPFDVAAVAAVFGGGGHRLAAGCTLEGPLAEAEARLVAEVERQMAAGERP